MTRHIKCQFHFFFVKKKCTISCWLRSRGSKHDLNFKSCGISFVSWSVDETTICHPFQLTRTNILPTRYGEVLASSGFRNLELDWLDWTTLKWTGRDQTMICHPLQLPRTNILPTKYLVVPASGSFKNLVATELNCIGSDRTWVTGLNWIEVAWTGQRSVTLSSWQEQTFSPQDMG